MFKNLLKIKQTHKILLVFCVKDTGNLNKIIIVNFVQNKTMNLMYKIEFVKNAIFHVLIVI